MSFSFFIFAISKFFTRIIYCSLSKTKFKDFKLPKIFGIHATFTTSIKEFIKGEIFNFSFNGASFTALFF